MIIWHCCMHIYCSILVFAERVAFSLAWTFSLSLSLIFILTFSFFPLSICASEAYYFAFVVPLLTLFATAFYFPLYRNDVNTLRGAAFIFRSMVFFLAYSFSHSARYYTCWPWFNHSCFSDFSCCLCGLKEGDSLDHYASDAVILWCIC